MNDIEASHTFHNLYMNRSLTTRLTSDTTYIIVPVIRFDTWVTRAPPPAPCSYRTAKREEPHRNNLLEVEPLLK